MAGSRIRTTAVQEHWGEFFSRVPWSHFATLTFAPRIFPVGNTRAEEEAVRWCSLMEYGFRRPIGWLVATERGMSGIWHAHVLLAEVDDLQPFETLWRLRNGHVSSRRVDSARQAVLYATKEAADQGHIVVSDGMARYKSRLRNESSARLC